MLSLLLDANLPDRFNLWKRAGAIHVKKLGEEWSDAQIWSYARQHNLTIVTQDNDFAHRIRQVAPPPRVIQLCLGNQRYPQWRRLMTKHWPEVVRLTAEYKLVEVYVDQVIGVI